MGIETIIAKVEDVDTEKKIAYAKEHEISFDKLVFATGSTPFVHSSLQDSLAFEGVFTVPKNKVLIDIARDYIEKVNDVLVVGTGFIGIEMAMEFAESGKNVTVIGGSKHILKGPFDPEVAIQAEEIMLAHGITFIGNDRVDAVIDHDGDAVVKGCASQKWKAR